MVRPAPSRSRAVDFQIIDFLSEYARYLVAAGITNPRLAAIVRLAFFRAASTHGRFGNEKLNQSAIATMTGLTRLQVRRFAIQKQATPPETRDRLENVIDGWTTDRRFTTRGSSPKPLRLTGRGNTFEALVQKYGGDVTPRSVLRELQRHKYASLRKGTVTLKATVSPTREEIRLRRLSKALADLLRARNEREVGQRFPLRAMNLEVTYPATSDRGRLILAKATAQNLEAFAARIQAAGIATSIDSPPRNSQARRRTRTRIVLLTEDLESSGHGQGDS